MLVEEVFVTQNVTRVRFESLLYIRGISEEVRWFVRTGNLTTDIRKVVDPSRWVPVSIWG
jgi:hypothetical protein